MTQEPEVQINPQDLKREKIQEEDNLYGKNLPYDIVFDENGDIFEGIGLEDI